MDELIATAGWITTGYLLGSIPFSVLLARWLRHADLARIGDGNPGAANAWKAGGWQIGVAALALDYLKGAAPVALAHYVFGLSGWSLAAAALAPVIGHACSVFLRLRGGKALAVTFGIWTGLTLWQAPLVLGILFIVGIALIKEHAWTVMFGMLGVLIYLIVRGSDPVLLGVWVGNLAILIAKHWPALVHAPHLHSRLFNTARQR